VQLIALNSSNEMKDCALAMHSRSKHVKIHMI
jgi:hypothetical protein